MIIEQTYDETLIRFMIEQSVFFPMVADMEHSEFCSCIGVSRDGLEWSFVNRRNISRIDEDSSCAQSGFNERALWDSAYRTKTRPGRVIRKLYLCAGLPEPRPEVIAEIVRRWDLFIGLARNDYSFDMFSGEQIRWAYLRGHNVENDNGLHCSCMNKPECQPYLDIYVKNRQVKLAVVMQGGLIAARALVWDDTQGGSSYYDRIYSADNYTADLLREHCETSGLINCYESGRRLAINLNLVDFRQYPYLDTFCYIGMDSGAAFNYEPDEWYRLCGSQHGTYDEHNAEDDCGYCCHSCDGEVNERDVIYINGDAYCSGCVRYSERYDDYIVASDAIYCECEDGYILYDDCVKLEDGTYAHVDDAIELYDGEYAHKDDEDLIELHDGRWARNDDDNIVLCSEYDTYAMRDECVSDRDGEYILEEYSVELYDGEWALEDNAEVLYDGRYAHIDDTVCTYNGLVALCDECAVLSDGRFALIYDPIVQFDTMSKADRGSLAAWAA